MANKNLSAAKEAKKDEFYTQLEDINKELKYYREHFRGKTVLCNCDIQDVKRTIRDMFFTKRAKKVTNCLVVSGEMCTFAADKRKKTEK